MLKVRFLSPLQIFILITMSTTYYTVFQTGKFIANTESVEQLKIALQQNKLPPFVQEKFDQAIQATGIFEYAASTITIKSKKY